MFPPLPPSLSSPPCSFSISPSAVWVLTTKERTHDEFNSRACHYEPRRSWSQRCDSRTCFIQHSHSCLHMSSAGSVLCSVLTSEEASRPPTCLAACVWPVGWAQTECPSVQRRLCRRRDRQSTQTGPHTCPSNHQPTSGGGNKLTACSERHRLNVLLGISVLCRPLAFSALLTPSRALWPEQGSLCGCSDRRKKQK